MSFSRVSCGTMTSVTVDTNAAEDALAVGLTTRLGAVVTRRRLDVGDLLLEHQEHGTIVIERKSWHVARAPRGMRARARPRAVTRRPPPPPCRADLASSIADGRYGCGCGCAPQE